MRFIAYWLIVTAVTGGLYAVWSSLSAPILVEIVAEGLNGDLTRVSSEPFAFSLAKALACLGFGLLIAFGVLHALAVSVSIGRARAMIQGYKSKRAFADDLDGVRERMKAHPLLGHAWKKFHKRHSRPCHCPPQGGRRNAGGATRRSGGRGATAMQSALQDLLHAATFKFSTSIAGLAVSIVLAFAFRLYAIRIEASVGDFCEALESKLNYLSPQSLSVEIRDSLTAQLAQLKEINSEAFFARFGHEVAPSINTALTSALSPLTQEVRSAVEQLDHNSHEGVQDLVKQFSDTLRGGAGSELRELGAASRPS